ncbi:MAG: NfeD family protein [Flavobacteriales bacterium]|nr:NfeD family protein [Flavobacteriales bacterium]MCB9447802.1 NfeD family protein [Flavobacteriales bacterium]
MTFTTIILILLLGLGLIILEFLVIPGTTIVGFLGAALVVAAVLFAYRDHGSTSGHVILAVSAVILGGMFILGFRAKTWERLSVRTEITGKVNVLEEGEVNPADKGKSISRLAPMGKAVFNEKMYEVQSTGAFIAEGTDVEVTKVSGNKIWVKQVG